MKTIIDLVYAALLGSIVAGAAWALAFLLKPFIDPLWSVLALIFLAAGSMFFALLREQRANDKDVHRARLMDKLVSPP